MRDLWRLFEKCIEHKLMLRFSVHPGGARHVGIYKDDEQYLYDGTLDEIEKQVLNDFIDILGPAPKPPLGNLPTPPGFPKP